MKMNRTSTSYRNTSLTLMQTCFLIAPKNNGSYDGSVGDTKRPSSAERRRTTFKTSEDPGSPPPPRPTELGVGPPHRVNTLREEEAGERGSLPCSPDPAEDQRVDSETRRHIYTFLTDHVGSARPPWKQEKVQATMRRVVDGVLEKHQYAYNGMIKKLELDGRGEDMSFVTSVARSLFADGTTNWGRIASLIAFGAVLCDGLRERGKEQCVAIVAREISAYLLSDQREWLEKNNSWDGFVEFFHVTDPESTVRNTLMAFAGVAGLGATLALLIR